MKYILLFLLLSCTGVWAQVVDAPSGGMAIPRAKSNATPVPAAPSTESNFTITPEKKSEFKYPTFTVGDDRKNFSMYEKDEFVNRGSEFAVKANEIIKPRGESNVAYRGNQYFGEVKTKTKFIQVMARDFAYADGDRIKVMVNDRVIMSEIVLTNEFKSVMITLDPGFNKIDFEALNQGTSGPNTAEFRVYDDKNELISNNEWNLATGFKASVMVVKE